MITSPVISINTSSIIYSELPGIFVGKEIFAKLLAGGVTQLSLSLPGIRRNQPGGEIILRGSCAPCSVQVVS